jgi:predicted RND superfamily exporter protein
VIERLLDRIASLVLKRPVAVLLAVGAVTVLLAANTRNLELRTDLVDLMGDSGSARAARELLQEMGYGNRFFVVVEASGDGERDAERMEQAADRLVAEMDQSGLFLSARSGVTEAEMLQIARFYVDHFPAFVDASRREELRARLCPAGVEEQVRKSTGALLSPLSTLGPEYLVLDPLGLLELVDPATRQGAGLTGFDLDWGSGFRFFSRDHRALLVLAEPRRPSSDYEFAVRLMEWVRPRLSAIQAEGSDGEGPLRLTPVGAHAYADQNRALIERNIKVASAVSVGGNLLLLILVYRWLPALVLTVLPTMLSILWTTGVISSYPGEVNLISLAFIAILAGLGDDQVTYFFSRVPQETSGAASLVAAIRQTYATTGKSVLFCVLTSGTATATLALARFKGLAELGLVLTVGLLMLLLHTLFTIPALLYVIWPRFPVRTEGGPFRFLPALARGAGRVVAGSPRLVLVVGMAALLVAGLAIPRLQVAGRLEGFSERDDPAFVGQRLLATRFGLEGAPLVLMVEGGEQEVLERTARLQAGLQDLRRRGELRAVLAPNSLVPSETQQEERRSALAGVDLDATAAALEQAVREGGLAPSAFDEPILRLRRWASGNWPEVSVEVAAGALPPGLLDPGVRELSPGRFLGVVTVYSADPAATASLSPQTLSRLQAQAGPFQAFSYDQMAIDLQAQIVSDSRKASVATTLGVVLVVALLFRSLPIGLLVLLPVAYGIVVTVGLLVLTGHRFGGMGFAAFPLIVGIGIDNGIHLVRRALERPGQDPARLLAGSGAALIQTNLTTIVGFGALMSATIPPLAELGQITAVGMTVTLLASLFVVPPFLVLMERRRGCDHQPPSGSTRAGVAGPSC